MFFFWQGKCSISVVRENIFLKFWFSKQEQFLWKRLEVDEVSSNQSSNEFSSEFCQSVDGENFIFRKLSRAKPVQNLYGWTDLCLDCWASSGIELRMKFFRKFKFSLWIQFMGKRTSYVLENAWFNGKRKNNNFFFIVKWTENKLFLFFFRIQYLWLFSNFMFSYILSLISSLERICKSFFDFHISLAVPPIMF